MYKNDPREIKAKFDCLCAESGAKINKGQKCIFYPLERKVFSLESKQAENFYSWLYDVNILNNNY